MRSRSMALWVATAAKSSGWAKAIRTAAFQGTVVVVSYLAGEASALYLGNEFHHNRIRLVSSQAAGDSPTLSGATP